MLALAYSSVLAVEEGVEEEEDIFLVPNATILVELLLFAVVLFVVWKYIVPPVSAAMAERAATIARSGSDVDATARKLAEATAAYDAALAEARAEATRMREEARAQHKAAVDEAATTAAGEADRQVAETRAQLAAEREQALAGLQAEVATLSKQLAQRVVGEPV